MDEFLIWQVAAKISVEKQGKQIVGQFAAGSKKRQVAYVKLHQGNPFSCRLQSFIISNTVLLSFHEQRTPLLIKGDKAHTSQG